MRPAWRPTLTVCLPLVLVLLGVACGTREPSTVENPPNFVFILADDLGWTDLGCYGSSFYETPNLDRLASQGARFTSAYAACPVCSPTRASIMTGKYPARLHLTDWIPGRQASEGAEPWARLVAPPFRQELPLDEVTIAEALKEAGYATFFAGKWHLGTEDFHPEQQGFDWNIGGMHFGSPRGGYFAPWDNPKLPKGEEGEYLPDRLTTETIRFLESVGEEPFFVYLSFYLVHNPQQAKDELVERFRKKAESLPSDVERFRPEGRHRARQVQDQPVYAGMVYSLDENIGRLTDALERLGYSDNTVLFFMSDNGGLSTSEELPTSNVPLRAGKGWLYEGGIREPLIIKWPGTTSAGVQISEPVISTDFYPTILEMAGLPLRPEQHVDGRSLVPLLRGEPGLGERTLFWHYPHYSNQGGRPGSALRQGSLKLIEFLEDSRVEVYDLAEDIGEARNLSDQMPERAEELKKILEDWRERLRAGMPQPNPGFDPQAGGPTE